MERERRHKATEYIVANRAVLNIQIINLSLGIRSTSPPIPTRSCTVTTDNVVWGTMQGGNIVWGTVTSDNIVWGTSHMDNVVWGSSDDDNVVRGTSHDDNNVVWATIARAGGRR